MAKDAVASSGLMLSRIGFTLALVLGLIFLFDLIDAGALVLLHMIAGIMTVAGIWLTVFRFVALKRSGGLGPLYGAAGLAAAGAAMGLGLLGEPGLVHMAVMIGAVGLTEMGAARARRAG